MLIEQGRGNAIDNLWLICLLVSVVLGIVLWILSSWLSRRNLHGRSIKWNWKKAWYPWWLQRG